MDKVSVAGAAVIAAAIVLAVITATANNTAKVGARREVAVDCRRSSYNGNNIQHHHPSVPEAGWPPVPAPVPPSTTPLQSTPSAAQLMPQQE